MKNKLQKDSVTTILTLMMILFAAGFSQNSMADKAARSTQLLNYFKNGCSMSNEWTNVAIGQSQALIENLRAIEKDDDCSSAAGMANNLTMLDQYITSIAPNETERQILALKNQEQTLLLALAASVVPDEILGISAQLREVQVQIAGLESDISFNQSYDSLSGTEQHMSSILASTQGLFSAMEASQGCWNKNPGILSGVASLGGTIATAVSSSGYTLIVAAAADLLKSVVDFSRKWGVRRNINRQSRGIQSTAFQCALEQMTKNWCAAEDAKRSIELHQRVITDNIEDNVWQGVHLLDRELPSLLEWFKEVRAGSEPQTQADADRQTAALWRQTHIVASKKNVGAIIRENKIFFDDALTAGDKWKALKIIIIQIQSKLEFRGSSVFYEIVPASYAPYYLLGLASDDPTIRNAQSGEYKNFESYDFPGTPSLIAVTNKFNNEWIVEAERKIQVQLNQVLQVDPLGVVTNAIDDFGNRSNITPRESITALAQFLSDNMPPEFLTNHQRIIYLNTITTLNGIGIQVDMVFNSPIPASDLLILSNIPMMNGLETCENTTSASDCAATALTNISSLAKLNFGPIFIQNRILRAIRQSLNAIVISRRRDGDLLGVQLLAAQDMIKTLEKYSPNGTLNLTQMRHSIAQSQSVSQGTISGFVKSFGNQIQKVLKNYDKLAKESGEGSDGPNMMAKADLCLKLLAAPVWPKKIPFKLCSGLQLKHINPKGPKSVLIKKDLLKTKFSERACLHRDFFRRSLIFDRFKI